MESFMLYAAFVFWALVAMFAARAVYDLLAKLIPTKMLNYLLLPGTLVAQVGYHVALLVTGATINQSRLANESTGEPELQADAKPKIPVIGPIVVAVLPMILCGIALYWAADWLSTRGMVRDVGSLPQSLPYSLGVFWDQAARMVRTLEGTLAVWTNASWSGWSTWGFAYITICLMIRLSPLSKDLRPALLGVGMFGIIGALVSHFTTWPQEKLARFWTNLSFLVANLLLLLFAALAVAALLGLYNILKGGQGAPAGGGGKPAGKPMAKPA